MVDTSPKALIYSLMANKHGRNIVSCIVSTLVITIAAYVLATVRDMDTKETLLNLLFFTGILALLIGFLTWSWIPSPMVADAKQSFKVAVKDGCSTEITTEESKMGKAEKAKAAKRTQNGEMILLCGAVYMIIFFLLAYVI